MDAGLACEGHALREPGEGAATLFADSSSSCASEDGDNEICRDDSVGHVVVALASPEPDDEHVLEVVRSVLEGVLEQVTKGCELEDEDARVLVKDDSEAAVAEPAERGPAVESCEQIHVALREEYEFYVATRRVFFHSHLYMWILFILAAILTGAISSGFTKAVESATSVLNSYVSDENLQPLIFVTAPVGFTFIVLMVYYFFWGTSGSGIPLEIAMLEYLGMLEANKAGACCTDDSKLRVCSCELDHLFGDGIRQVLSWRILVGKFGLTVLGVVLGASVGREGPTVQIASCVLYGCMRIGFRYSFKIRKEVLHSEQSRLAYMKAVTLAGGAAGIAAAFNTPLGGIVFAIEEMGNLFDRALGKLVLTTVAFSGITSLFVTGGYRFFGFVVAEAPPEQIAVAATICCVIGGILGGAWSLALYLSLKLKRNVRVIREHPFVVSFVFSVLFAINGYLSGSVVYGSGYEQARIILEKDYTFCTRPQNSSEIFVDGISVDFFITPPTYGFTKMLSTLLGYLTGIPGGIFSPSLSAGAGWGALVYCGILRKIYSDIPPSIVTLLMMQSYFSAVTQSPLTSYMVLSGTVAVSESQNSVSLEIARLTISLLASFVSQNIMPKSLYAAIASLGIPPIPETNLAPDLRDLQEIQRQRKKENQNRRSHVFSEPAVAEESWY
mmetsp:Transcript_15758/g.25752  ORF Transcript_15758/g.25752 Transcript_15758/m.25752 type:complete len:670 (+) Transcript_15758:727-2736(+)|eukprot:CAMPEP_0203752970 /NCGR_PEP_ID=MMETSP0098-20131031/6821_1 /ASSEMBLY_ACC=CAM_ASM_000208 /TAXON_ID=96639 /ORGANISM=" , Strain NY0313808BC1" /LENGTH=669 /DNA_ID=CAMNT_0050643379 /DNA_START=589 /DNA_END=2598 /DNA_ORIENTATION=-